MVLVIPARNEAAVIGRTLTSLSLLRHSRCTVLVMNDGSTDATGDIARSFSQVVVVDRAPEIAGQGKGAVLNHAFHVVRAMFPGDGSRVVVGVMDADGEVDPDCLEHVLPAFADPTVAGVQIGVRIANAADGLLARMQDIEFVGFSGLVQQARNDLGSVGLGGNGQFTRLSSLLSLGRDPWTDCLSEDLDLSLSLVGKGFKVRFVGSTYVAQQGLTRIRPLLRQRARWVQGHYQCWRHLTGLVRNRDVPWKTRIDLSLYLTMIAFVMVVSVGTVLTLASMAGLVVLTNSWLEGVPGGFVYNSVLLGLSFGGPFTFLMTYQRRARHPLLWWEVPACAALFCVYGYHWVLAQFWALFRIATGRRGWAKTPRVAVPA